MTRIFTKRDCRQSTITEYIYKNNPRGNCAVRVLLLIKNGTSENSLVPFWRHHPDLNRGIKLLQSSALPLGYGALCKKTQNLKLCVFCNWSGRRDSNSRRSPWQGDALPLSHSRIYYGASGWNRTADTGIFSPLLYRLSYRGV